MANEGIAVSSSVIKWARTRAGLDLQEAAEKFAKIAAWEAGEALPTYPQLEAMAEKFRRGMMPGARAAALVGGGILTTILYPAMARRFLDHELVRAAPPSAD
jgi:hypothetical protein